MNSIKNEIEQALLANDPSVLGNELPYKLKISAAALLVYAAKADGKFSEDEFTAVMKAIAKEFQTPDLESAEMIEVANYLHESNKRVQDFTQILNQSLAPDQKEDLFALVIKVIRSDGRISVAEEILASQLARSLGITLK